MGAWWLALSSFAHINLFMILVALVPFPTPRQWKAIFEFGVVRFLTNWIFFDLWKLYLMMGCVCLMSLMDGIRSYYRLAKVDYNSIGDPLAQQDALRALAMAQRNYFIAGSAFFICICFPRLVQVLKQNANMEIKMETLQTASKVFQSLVRMMQIERNIAETGGVELSITEALKNELQDLHRDREAHGNTPRLDDIRKILEIYERRIERERDTSQGAGVQQESIFTPGHEGIATAYFHGPQPIPRRRRTIYSPYGQNQNSNWVSYRHPQTRFGPIESD